MAEHSFLSARDVLKADFKSDPEIKSATLFTLNHGKAQLWQYIDREHTDGLDIGAMYDQTSSSWKGSYLGKRKTVMAPFVTRAMASTELTVAEMGEEGILAIIPIKTGNTTGWLAYEYDYGPLRAKIQRENLFHRDILAKTQEASEKVRQVSSGILDDSIRSAVISGILAFFLAMGLAMFMAFSFVKRITGPIQQLTATADQLSAGTFQRTQVPQTGDEVELLGKSFNAMVDAIQARDHELKKYHENLEDTLQKRTQELEVERSKSVQSSKLAALGEMAAGMAHEINNPLAIIISSALMLRKRLVAINANDEIMTRLGVIESTTQRVAKIIKNLRSFARDGSQDEYTDTTLNEILVTTLDFCQEKFKGHGIKVEILGTQDPIKVKCNGTQISQVILNLLNNAAEAIEEAGGEKWIKMQLFGSNDEASLRISNSGAKIPADVAEKLFRPFFTTKPVGKGTGLGLSISKGIMESHKGRLLLDLQGDYTCFELSFPRVPAVKSAA